MLKDFVCLSVLFSLGLVLVHGSGGSHGGHSRRLDPAILCANSTNNTECTRRVEVCRNMHRGSRSRMTEVLNTCAAQLNITSLPQIAEEADRRQAFRTWMTDNPEDKRRIFTCVHQGMYHEDGTMNREAMVTKIRTLLDGQNENELKEELISKVNTCDEGENRRDYFQCVFMGCATPQ